MRQTPGTGFTSRSATRSYLALLTGLLAFAVASGAQARVFHHQFLAFGTLIEITIRGDDPALAQRAFGMLQADFAGWHRDWYAWNPGKLQRLNRALASGDWVEAPELIPLIKRAQALSAASQGLFNPAIGRLIELWGFAGDHSAGRKPPSPESVARLVRSAPSMDDIQLRGTRVGTRNPAVMLDLSGLAKGYALDRSIQTLRRLGVKNAIVNAGGDLRAIGRHGDRPWRIGIRDPRGEGLIASLEVGDGEGVFTSGDYERFFLYQGRRYQHIIDPRDGYPVANTVAATVVAHPGDLAGAAAVALVVAGRDEWLTVAAAMGVEQAMLVDAQGQIYITPKLAARLHFIEVPAGKVSVAHGFQPSRQPGDPGATRQPGQAMPTGGESGPRKRGAARRLPRAGLLVP